MHDSDFRFPAVLPRSGAGKSYTLPIDRPPLKSDFRPRATRRALSSSGENIVNVQEIYAPQPIAANGAATVKGNQLGGFLCTVSGTLTVTLSDATVIVNAVPVTAGVYTPLPFGLNGLTATVQLAGGAAGTLGSGY